VSVEGIEEVLEGFNCCVIGLSHNVVSFHFVGMYVLLSTYILYVISNDNRLTDFFKIATNL
jgi:hypothetical protein